MSWFRCTGGSGGGGISEITKIGLTDWEALSQKDASTLYLVTADNREDIILYQYLGSKRLLQYKEDISDYEFWIENSHIVDFVFDTDVVVGGSNYSRNWQIEFNIGKRGTGSECCLISFNEGSNVEIYWNSYGQKYLKIYNGFFGGNGDDLTSDFENKNMVIKQENGVVTVYTDGIQTYTTNVYQDMGTKKLRLFRRGYGDYIFSGFVNYFGFKWLD